MKPILLSLYILVFFTACSSPQPINQWQHDTSTMTKNYQKHFLQNKLLRAKLDLRHARKSASRSADLGTLIDVELTRCAMQVAVLRPDPCKNAHDLLVLESKPKKSAYLHLLRDQLSPEEIKLLPSAYRDFAQAYLKKQSREINRALEEIKPLSSRLIASSLAQGYIDKKNTQSLIDELSYHGYKNPLLSWLDFQMHKESDPENKARIQAKIKVLTSN